MTSLAQRVIPVSHEIERYLKDRVGIPKRKLARICNGVDTEIFWPSPAGKDPLPVPDFASSGCFVVGWVGRMEAVKDPVTLARAFVRLLELMPEDKERLRLVMVGEGSLRASVRSLLKSAGVDRHAWLPGNREDVPRLLRGMDLFALPSWMEGISNTILEAMATGLPIVATRVGGNPELVVDEVSGKLVPPKDPEAMARAMAFYVGDPGEMKNHGMEARLRIEKHFSLDVMVEKYLSVYDSVLSGAGT